MDSPPEYRENLLVLFTKIPTKWPSLTWRVFNESLPDYLAEGTSKFKFEIDQKRHLLARLLLHHYLLRLDYKLPDYLSDLSKNEFNRPFFKSLPIDFNVSHSGDYAVVVISKEGRVGIDVELVRPVDLTNFTRVMNKQQWQLIHASSQPVETFFKLWTSKESVIKADGRGVAMNLSEIYFKGDQAFYLEQSWYLSQIFIHQNYQCHVASNLPFKGVTKEEVQAAALIQPWL